MAAALTLLVFLSGIIEQGAPTYLDATGQTQQPFLGRWLLRTAAMFGISAVAFAARLSCVDEAPGIPTANRVGTICLYEAVCRQSPSARQFRNRRF